MTWSSLADDAIAALQVADTGNEIPHVYAYAAGAVARRSGWSHPDVDTYLGQLYSLRNPDGGWGLNYAWDAFQNNSINAADCTYTITLADHTGPVLLDALAAGAPQVVAADIQTVVNLLATTNSAQYGAESGNLGRCIAYSRDPDDNTVPAGCVHNVSAAAAGFLWRARQAGFDHASTPLLCANVSKKEAVDWKWQTRWWPYIGTGAAADTDHTAAEAWNLWQLLPALAYETGRKILTQFATLNDEPIAAVAIPRLATLSPEFTSMAAPLIDYVEDLVTNPPTDRNILNVQTPCRALAQAAYWCSQVV